MSMGSAVAVAAMFFWLGSVVAISFIEAPLKFRAPGVTLQIGLGIGRLVFRALNGVEVVLAAAVVAALVLSRPGPPVVIAAGVAVAALAGQLLVVRPRLTKRSDAVLDGTADTRSRSRAHYGYVVLEVAKVAGLVVAGVALLAAS